MDGKGGFCCLGVLLDISKKGEWEGGDYYIEDFDEDDGRRVYEGDLGQKGCDQFGIPMELHNTLVHMNDGVRDFKGDPQSFEAIANYIEAKL